MFGLNLGKGRGSTVVFCLVCAALLLLGGSALVGKVVLSFGPESASPACTEPLTARAEADARAWLRGHVSSVGRLQRNAVVFNWTVVPGGSRPRPGWQFSEWYLRSPDGSLRIAGIERMSGLGG